jgi:tripartite-type tricarboxylate transporter receptor subunit TctC
MAAWLLKITLAAALLSAGAVRASDDFYAGKVVSLVIGTPVGGGYDTSARLIARHLGSHIPGNPSIVPKNMPGSSGTKAANYMANIAARDGTVLGLFHEYVPLDQMLDGEGVEFDASKFNWIGRLTSTAIVYFTWHTSPSSSFARVRERETILGGTSGRGLMEYLPRVMNDFAGAKFKVVNGYSGSRNVFLAMERGEVEAGFALWSQLKFQNAEWLRDKKINVIISITDKRLADLPDVPSLVEVIRDNEKKALFKTLTLTAQIGHSIQAPPGVPPERVAIMRTAFNEMLTDPAFLADANKAGVFIDPAPGEQLQKIVEDLLSLTPKARQELRDAVGAAQ